MSSTFLSGERSRELRVVRATFCARAIGLAFGGLLVAVPLYEIGVSWPWWVLLAADAFVWPWVAYWLSSRSESPVKMEERHLIFDNAMGGVWIAAIHFNWVPSAILMATLSMDKLAYGGWPLVLRALMAMSVTTLCTSALLAFPVQIESSLWVIFASTPHLLIYPMIVSTSAHALLKRVSQQAVQLEKMGRIDGLTGVFNRSYWTECAEQEMRRAKRIPAPASLLVIDLDHFKAINDQHGHVVGDDVLRQVAAALKQCVREVDTVGRYGGDEFVVLLPSATITTARVIAGRIVDRIEKVAADGLVPFGVSVGAAELAVGADSLRAWINRADAGLYSAKSQGRGQIAVSEEFQALPVT